MTISVNGWYLHTVSEHGVRLWLHADTGETVLHGADLATTAQWEHFLELSRGDQPSHVPGGLPAAAIADLVYRDAVLLIQRGPSSHTPWGKTVPV